MTYRRKMWWLVVACGVVLVMLMAATAAVADKKHHSHQGWLGVYLGDVDDEVQEDLDLASSDGVLVLDVVDDSPAEDAGLESEDVILKFNDQPVNSTRKLTRLIEDTEPDAEVRIDIIRNKQPQQITVTMGEEEADHGFLSGLFDFDEPSPRIIRIPPRPVVRPRPNVRIQLPEFDDSPVFIGVQLLDLNRQLREYFEIPDREGVLVEKVDGGSPAEKAGIKAGDVIVDIDGAKITESEDVLDELRDHDPGDKLNVTVLRKGVRQTFTVEVEEGDWSDSRLMLRKTHGGGSALLWDRAAAEELRKAAQQMRYQQDDLRKNMQEAREQYRRALLQVKNRAT